MSIVLLIPFNIISRSSEKFGVVLGKTEHHIAVLAKESAYPSSEMTMIDCQWAYRFFVASACGLWFATKGTHSILFCKHLIIFCRGQIELLAEFALSTQFGVVYTQIRLSWMCCVIFFSLRFKANLAPTPHAVSPPGGTISNSKFRERLYFMTSGTLLCLTWCWYLLFVPSVFVETRLASGLLLIVILSISSEVRKRLYFMASVALLRGRDCFRPCIQLFLSLSVTNLTSALASVFAAFVPVKVSERLYHRTESTLFLRRGIWLYLRDWAINGLHAECFKIKGVLSVIFWYTAIHSLGHSLLSRPGLYRVAPGQHHVYLKYTTKPLHRQVYRRLALEVSA